MLYQQSEDIHGCRCIHIYHVKNRCVSLWAGIYKNTHNSSLHKLMHERHQGWMEYGQKCRQKCEFLYKFSDIFVRKRPKYPSK